MEQYRLYIMIVIFIYVNDVFNGFQLLMFFDLLCFFSLFYNNIFYKKHIETKWKKEEEKLVFSYWE